MMRKGQVQEAEKGKVEEKSHPSPAYLEWLPKRTTRRGFTFAAFHDGFCNTTQHVALCMASYCVCNFLQNRGP